MTTAELELVNTIVVSTDYEDNVVVEVVPDIHI